ncbi:uracil-DNA glycosylase family protein [Flavitalea sp. BT771]|uniref:uracil-DNA glycosylase family protein n=1 Tax=Flavitalea sp. BT771 TaxID=3063329 RepID=UPI0026E2E8F6|nr:uracil-DNA glycosylase family protein [Flavitalea sp. BT771]MDO6435590.1 uracil-DNA glycosylase family protein [Flavitalea sp. BT771]MDV6224490.1 uracil-DNA glycosylase family protein [Flavitalea sp. BT771]
MAVTSSPISHPTVAPCNGKICKSCGLYLNQAPIFDERRMADVFWVGLSAVRFEDGQERLPLSPLTASGALISQIEQPYTSKLRFYKTNLVKCLPLKDDRIRYPMEREMEKCFSNFEWELENLRPATVYLLGKQVATFILKKLSGDKPILPEDFTYTSVRINNISFIPVHHPSYILVYKRKMLEQYVKHVQILFPSESRGEKCKDHSASHKISSLKRKFDGSRV